jgi:hypothetical protein
MAAAGRRPRGGGRRHRITDGPGPNHGLLGSRAQDADAAVEFAAIHIEAVE